MAMMFDSHPVSTQYVPQARSQKSVLSAVENRRFSLLMIGGFALFLAFAHDMAVDQDGAVGTVAFNMAVSFIQSMV